MERLTGLTLLNLENCKGLLTLPRILSTLTSLKKVNLSGSLIFDKLPKNQRNLEYFGEHDIRGTTRRQAHSRGFEWQLLKSRFLSCWSLPNHDIGLVLPTLFSSLCSLTELNLCYCNLSDGAILSDLSNLSYLQYLNLSGNKFEYIPESISQLSKLKCVYLEYCNRLRSLPKFAASVQYLNTRYCNSLERNLNEIDIINSDETGFHVLRGTSLGFQDYRVQNLELVGIDLGRKGYGSYPEDRFPRLYNNLNKGHFVRLQFDRDDTSNWLGFVLYFVLEAHDCCCGSLAHVRGHKDLVIHFDTNEGPLKQPLTLTT